MAGCMQVVASGLEVVVSSVGVGACHQVVCCDSCVVLVAGSGGQQFCGGAVHALLVSGCAVLVGMGGGGQPCFGRAMHVVVMSQGVVMGPNSVGWMLHAKCKCSLL
jgi:hypothetical protein